MGKHILHTELQPVGRDIPYYLFKIGETSLCFVAIVGVYMGSDDCADRRPDPPDCYYLNLWPMSSHMNRITIFHFSMVFLGGKSGQQHDDLVQALLCVDSRVRIYMQAATSRTVYTHRDVQSCSSRFTLLPICAYIASHCVSFDSRFVNNRLLFSSSSLLLFIIPNAKSLYYNFYT